MAWYKITNVACTAAVSWIDWKHALRSFRRLSTYSDVNNKRNRGATARVTWLAVDDVELSRDLAKQVNRHD
jgi:hypothetical protein